MNAKRSAIMIYIQHAGLLFCGALAVMFFATWLMGKQERFFFTMDPLKRKFNILEMEFPGKSFDLEYLIEGIYKLPHDAKRTIRSIRRQLALDYLLFIPSAYGGIFILSMHVAANIPFAKAQQVFVAIAWAQVIPFVLDYIENTYFWIKVGKKDQGIPKPDISDDAPVSTSFIFLKWLEIFKWGIPLVSFITCISVMAYFWLTGNF